jgi:hypothetical protein
VGKLLKWWTDDLVNVAGHRWIQKPDLFVVEVLGGGLCSAVGVVWIMMVMMI